MSVITAEKIYQEIIRMPVPERERLFSIIARHGFEKDVYRHKEVFDDIRKTPFTLHEAAEYLGVAKNCLGIDEKVIVPFARSVRWYKRSVR